MQQFDLFTFVATIVNFFILVALLRIFLYDRVITAVKKRQEEMDRKWNEAEQEKQQAEEEKQQYSERYEELKEQKQQILSKQREEAAHKKKELLSAAREEIEEKKEQWFRSLDREEKDLSNIIRRRIGNEVITLTKRLFTNLADSEVQEKIIDQFIERLNRLQKQEKENIRKNTGEGEQIRITCSFSLSDQHKRMIMDALEIKNSDIIQFVTDGKMNYGIELLIGETVYAWHVDDFLENVETSIIEAAKKGMS